MSAATRQRPPRILGTALLPGGSLAPVVVHLEAGRVADVERDLSPASRRALRRDRRSLVLDARHVLAPAFIDVHCHGAGGGSAHDDVASLHRMVSTLMAHGVGAFVAATITAPIPDLARVAARISGLIDRGAVGRRPRGSAELLGLHLEGPALSPVRSAGHDPAALVSPATLSRALSGGGEAWRSLRIVTYAPELDGGTSLARKLARMGVVASVGHTDADFAVAGAAYAAGARSTTHLFSGMPPLHHRDPGPVGAALAASPFIELLCDGVHVSAALLPAVARAIGDERLLLVSDALPLAATRLRHVEMPGFSIRVRNGRALNPDGSIAGSRLLLDGMVATAVRSGVPLSTALRGASENPARLLGLADRGVIAPGAVADLVVVARDGRLRRVLAEGSTGPTR